MSTVDTSTDEHIATFVGYFKSAVLGNRGECAVTMIVPLEDVGEAFKLGNHSGINLHITVTRPGGKAVKEWDPWGTEDDHEDIPLEHDWKKVGEDERGAKGKPALRCARCGEDWTLGKRMSRTCPGPKKDVYQIAKEMLDNGD